MKRISDAFPELKDFYFITEDGKVYSEFGSLREYFFGFHSDCYSRSVGERPDKIGRCGGINRIWRRLDLGLDCDAVDMTRLSGKEWGEN